MSTIIGNQAVDPAFVLLICQFCLWILNTGIKLNPSTYEFLCQALIGIDKNKWLNEPNEGAKLSNDLIALNSQTMMAQLALSLLAFDWILKNIRFFRASACSCSDLDLLFISHIGSENENLGCLLAFIFILTFMVIVFIVTVL